MEHLWHRVGNLTDIEMPPHGHDSSIEFDLLVSPYEVPEAIRGLKTKGGRFRIEFRYIDGPEHQESKRVDEHIEFFVGKHSGRLMGIEIDVQSLGVNQVEIQISIADLASSVNDTWGNLHRTSAGAVGNLKLAERAFAKRKDDVIRAFQTNG